MHQETEGRGLGSFATDARPAFGAGRVSFFVFDQLAGRLRHQLRALALAPLEKQQALAEDEAVEQEGLRVGFLGRKAGGAIELADIFQPRGVDAGDAAAAASSSVRAHCRIASSIAIASVFIRSE